MNPGDLNFHRPTSNSSLASKPVERSVAARFVKALRSDHQNHLFPVRQSAFDRHHSTETAVLIVHNDIIRAIDNGQLTVMLFLDLSSAFDTVDHDIMLSIPHRRFSVKGAELNWFHSYLTITLRRSPLVIATPILALHDSCTVPQGSVEFVLYTH